MPLLLEWRCLKKNLITAEQKLSSKTFYLTQTDRQTIINSRDAIAARMTSPLAHPSINIENIWRIVYNLSELEWTKEPLQERGTER